MRAFAGLVDGRAHSSIPRCASSSPSNRRHSRAAVPPVVKTRPIGAASRMHARSLGTGSAMLASEAPAMEQEASTSQSAIPCSSRKAVRGPFSESARSGSPNSRSITRQKRFCGCP